MDTYRDNLIHIMQRTQLYLPKSQIKKLKERARKEDVSMSELVRRFIENGENKDDAREEKAHEPLLASADRINTLGESAPADLAENTDEYLYGET